MMQCTATKIIFVGVTLDFANSTEFERVKNLFKISKNSIRVHISFTSFRDMITLGDIITEQNRTHLSTFSQSYTYIVSKKKNFMDFCHRSNLLYELSVAASVSVRRMFSQARAGKQPGPAVTRGTRGHSVVKESAHTPL